MSLPADSHVHSQFSWDTGGPVHALGRMEATCARAVQIGLPAVYFTEHLDLDPDWWTDPEDMEDHAKPMVGPDGLVRTPPFDVEGYLAEVERCRVLFPELHIGTGLEVGQPHRHLRSASSWLDLDRFDRVLGSLHTIPEMPDGGVRCEPNTAFRRHVPGEVVRAYLAEIPAMVASDAPFAVITHLDYALRYWPEEGAGPVDPREFEEEFRVALRAVAASGRALELNTRRLWPWLVDWWRQEGGRAVSLGSDAHEPARLAHGLPEAAAMAEAFGFRPGADPAELWRRREPLAVATPPRDEVHDEEETTGGREPEEMPGDDPSRGEATALTERRLAALLAQRYPRDTAGSDRGLGFALELVRAAGIDTVEGLAAALDEVDGLAVRRHMDTATEVTRVRRLDDELLARFGEGYIVATAGIGRGEHRAKQLRARHERLRDQVVATADYRLLGKDSPPRLRGTTMPAARVVREVAHLLAERDGASRALIDGVVSRSGGLDHAARARPVALDAEEPLWVATQIAPREAERLAVELLDRYGEGLVLMRAGERIHPPR